MVTQSIKILEYGVEENWRGSLSPNPHESLKAFLSEQELLGHGFVYRGFNRGRISIVERTGTDRDETSEPSPEQRTAHLSPEQYLCATPLGSGNLDWAVNAAFFDGENALSIYDRNRLDNIGPGKLLHKTKEGYSFLDALVAVVVPGKA